MEVAEFMPYPIELIRDHHAQLWAECFVVCAVARCRESGQKPWPLSVVCRDLLQAGTDERLVGIVWTDETEAQARKAERSYGQREVTENGAIGICGVAFSALSEGLITEVTLHGDGVDYWVDDRRAVLEVSGIHSGRPADLARRVRVKTGQLMNSHLFQQRRKPGYVFVVLFEHSIAAFRYYHP